MWPFYTLMLPWGVMHLIAYILLPITLCVKKHDLKEQWTKYIGILLTTIIYDTAWSFELLTDLCGSLIYQLAFAVLSFFLGLTVLTFFGVLSSKERKDNSYKISGTPPAKTRPEPESYSNMRPTDHELQQIDPERGIGDDQDEETKF